MAATKLFPGRAIRDAPRLLDTSEASEKRERSSETWPRPPSAPPASQLMNPCDLMMVVVGDTLMIT